jgi:PRTRC genetic system protein A
MKPTNMDRVLEAHTPVVVVPKFGEFEPLQRNGHRFLAAADGLWLESKRAWGRVLWPMAQQSGVLMPFGRLKRKVELAFGAIPLECMVAFVADARQAGEDEVGGVVIWNERSGELRYQRCESLRAGVGFLTTRQPLLADGEHIVVDLHSHGNLAAGFSATDLQDTGSEMVVAGVVGRIHLPEPQIKLSLFVCGLQVPCEVSDEMRSACARPVEQV